MKRFCWLMGVLVLISVGVVVLWKGQVNAGSVNRVCALWVPRFDYASPEDIRRIVANANEAGFSDIFFQVRGNGSVYFKSSIEPWAFELSGDNVNMLGVDPGWDPLQTAIDAAAGSGLRVHAYINVLPGWKGLQDPPSGAGQLWTEHPEWFMVDSLGCRMMPTSGWYAFMNPVMPEVREHLCALVKELCQYDVAGVHLDYIRYPHDYHLVAAQRYPNASKEDLMRHSEFSYDNYSLTEMAVLYGDDITGAEIAAYRCGAVTRTVAQIAETMNRSGANPLCLSASVMGSPDEGLHYAYQDSGLWVRDGLVDWAVQMNYATLSFEKNLKAMRRNTGRAGFRRSVVVGIYGKNEADLLLSQIQSVQDSDARGLAFFSYSLLFNKSHQPTQKGRILLPAIRSFLDAD
ncbi:MAG: family 10 glycosylhydrolase [Pontiellaceae bacterium]|nr:family 10 glycosylhydrolase [Pontiellaceae bacterium]MBN2786031.1 family 10 glycosylhydrolase [Pontiellaceae bacterium]